MGYSLRREELAWAAGFFDGEGSTSFARNKLKTRKYPRLDIDQTDPEVLERFKNAVGNIGKVVGPYPTNKKPKWKYVVYGIAECQTVICFLWQWLSNLKKQQYIKVLKECLFPEPYLMPEMKSLSTPPKLVEPIQSMEPTGVEVSGSLLLGTPTADSGTDAVPV